MKAKTKTKTVEELPIQSVSLPPPPPPPAPESEGMFSYLLHVIVVDLGENLEVERLLRERGKWVFVSDEKLSINLLPFSKVIREMMVAIFRDERWIKS